MSELLMKAKKAKEAVSDMLTKSTAQKDEALRLIARQLIQETPFILEENSKDIETARQKGVHESLVDRLMLNEARIEDMAGALEQLTHLPDPAGEVLERFERPNGLSVEKIAVPLGVIGMIYEARPNVTVDASSLCLKTGNVVLLRGSSSAIHSNKALVHVIHQALEQSDLPVYAVQLIEDTSRETASQLFKLNQYLDVLIPRGGKELIQTVIENASVPVLETGAGNCHIYIDETAHRQMAIDIVVNAKTQRPSVCNAIEKVIVHESWPDENVKELVETLQQHRVDIRIDAALCDSFPSLTVATEEDWHTEYLDYVLALKRVSSTQEAIEHINHYGSKHSEAIITENEENVSLFFQLVDSAALYHNASTRFTDGFEFGFGAEIGISTQKLHARGPMGLPALTSSKYVIRGNGQIRQ
ncbi:glutamate-5-semialdehyde dehydrogenase [Fictibacillus enclensis]|uniref:Gamma-glutamyl phosphate reductase n=1 Tax=Fictibacillus enclensis TaxID=1017270 RepID=A0A0V8JEJ3_9BACL|nr:glutamate-5-semialdehyde dehydrogenase [Fictibacillus enclensis]KSU85385.1 gamma-glutamyl-phosphate reductase [Fictibacillus enclensis]SCB95855.1 glutamate-5-semialdehyde dehydrogenase [Fictibacillus enclensis]